MYTLVGGVHWFVVWFWVLYVSFWGPEGSDWIGSTVEIQNAWFSARKVQYGSSFDRFSYCLPFSENLSWLPGSVFVVFSVRCFQIHIFEFFGRDRKVARWTVTQIRGGIPTGSALFDHFMPFEDFSFSDMFDDSMPFHVPRLPEKCTLIVSVYRMPKDTFTMGIYPVHMVVVPARWASGSVPGDLKTKVWIGHAGLKHNGYRSRKPRQLLWTYPE